MLTGLIRCDSLITLSISFSFSKLVFFNDPSSAKTALISSRSGSIYSGYAARSYTTFVSRLDVV